MTVPKKCIRCNKTIRFPNNYYCTVCIKELSPNLRIKELESRYIPVESVSLELELRLSNLRKKV